MQENKEKDISTGHISSHSFVLLDILLELEKK